MQNGFGFRYRRAAKKGRTLALLPAWILGYNQPIAKRLEAKKGKGGKKKLCVRTS